MMKSLLKNPLFYTNFFLFLIVAFLALNLVYPNFAVKVREAMAAIGIIWGEGNVIQLAKFTGGVAGNPSNQIGNSQIYDDGANVGIGTSAPGAKLDVVGDIALRLQNSGNMPRVHFRNQTTGAVWQLGTFGGAGPNDFSFGAYSGVSGNITMTSSGNVGIGISNPERALKVVKDDGAIYPFGAANSALYGVAIGARTGETFGTIQAGQLMSGGAPGNLAINPLGGYVGIGTAAPNGILEVYAANDAPWPLTLKNGAASNFWSLYPLSSGRLTIFERFNAGGYSEVMSIASGGNVGIGTSAPGAKLHVNGSMIVDNGYVYAYNNVYPIRLGELWGHTGLYNGSPAHRIYLASDLQVSIVNRSNAYGPPLEVMSIILKPSVAPPLIQPGSIWLIP